MTPLGTALFAASILLGCSPDVPDPGDVSFSPAAPKLDDLIVAEYPSQGGLMDDLDAGIGYRFRWLVDGQDYACLDTFDRRDNADRTVKVRDWCDDLYDDDWEQDCDRFASTELWTERKEIADTVDAFLQIPAEETEKGQSWRLVIIPIEEFSCRTGTRSSNSVSVRNSPPTARVSIEPDPPAAHDDLQAVPYDVEDPDPADDVDSVSFVYTWYRNDELTTYTGDTLASSETRMGETWTVRMVPYDSDNGDPAVYTVQIGNGRPEVTSVSLRPKLASRRTTSEPLIAEAVIVDQEEDDISPVFTWSWAPVQESGLSPALADYVEVQEFTPAIKSTDAANTWSATLPSDHFAKDEWVRVCVTGRDLGNGLASTPPVCESTIIVNTAPTLGTVTISDPITRAESPECELDDPVDVDGDELTFVTLFYVKTGQGTTSYPGSVDVSAYSVGDRVYCGVVASDGLTESEESFSESIKVTNAPPTISSVILSPDPLMTEHDLVATVVAEDPDAEPGDPAATVEYEWLVDGIQIGSETSDTLPANRFTKGEEVTVNITATDAAGEPAYSTASITVSNTAPVVTSVSITETEAYTDDTINATYTSTDADAEFPISQTYTWYVNGTAVTGVSTAALDGSSGHFQSGDAVTVAVDVCDDTDCSGTSTASASLTISDSAPTDPVIEFNPASPLEGLHDANCTVSTDSTDADGDTVSYTFTLYTGVETSGTTAWTTATAVTSSGTYTNNAIASADLVAGDLLKCEVQATANGLTSDTIEEVDEVLSATAVYPISASDIATTSGVSAYTCISEVYFGGSTTVGLGLSWEDTYPHTVSSVNVQLSWGVYCDSDALDGTCQDTALDTADSGYSCDLVRARNVSLNSGPADVQDVPLMDYECTCSVGTYDTSSWTLSSGALVNYASESTNTLQLSPQPDGSYEGWGPSLSHTDGGTYYGLVTVTYQ
jgi:hypothetical protein